MNPPFWWYLARASGMVAAVLLACTLAWGLLASTRLLRRPGLPAWLADLHRGLGGLTVIFVGVHLAALVADSTVHFSWAEILVPFASAWRRGPVALGVAALWGLAVVEGSSLLQRRMARRTWRRLHFLSYPVALLVAVHASTAGTDASSPVFRWVSILAVVVLSALVVVRAIRSTASPRGHGRAPQPARAPDRAPARPRPVTAAPPRGR